VSDASATPNTWQPPVPGSLASQPGQAPVAAFGIAAPKRQRLTPAMIRQQWEGEWRGEEVSRQPQDHLKKLSVLPKRQEQEKQAPEQNPIFAECLKIGEELAVYGIPWGFGIGVNTSEMKPAAFADAAAQILIQKGICTTEEWDNMVFTVLRESMQKVLEAVKNQRRSGLVLPNGTPVPPDLMPKKVD
jgi:hypothetical protein